MSALERATAVTTANHFVRAFVARFPVLGPAYEEHLRDNGELLPHVIFGIGEGFTDRIVDAYLRAGVDTLDWRSVLEFLEAHFDRGDREIDKVLDNKLPPCAAGAKAAGVCVGRRAS
jgi:hypothetical protein